MQKCGDVKYTKDEKKNLLSVSKNASKQQYLSSRMTNLNQPQEFPDSGVWVYKDLLKSPLYIFTKVFSLKWNGVGVDLPACKTIAPITFI